MIFFYTHFLYNNFGTNSDEESFAIFLISRISYWDISLENLILAFLSLDIFEQAL